MTTPPPDIDAIIEHLARHRQRATYGALAGLVGGVARSVMGRHPRTPRNSWVVSAATGEPTGYADHEKDPALRVNPRVIATAEHLRRWFTPSPQPSPASGRGAGHACGKVAPPFTSPSCGRVAPQAPGKWCRSGFFARAPWPFTDPVDRVSRPHATSIDPVKHMLRSSRSLIAPDTPCVSVQLSACRGRVDPMSRRIRGVSRFS